jgi:hypothetical protein
MLALLVAIAGCATHRHSIGSSAAGSSSSPVAAQKTNSGWYLMQPPVRAGNPDIGAKLADWQVLAFFAHSSQCDAARQQGLSAYSPYLPVSATGSTDSAQMSQHLASATLCVGADDPRINWFHIRSK